MYNITSIISEMIFMELDQITDLQYKSANSFVLTDNCGHTFIVNIDKVS